MSSTDGKPNSSAYDEENKVENPGGAKVIQLQEPRVTFTVFRDTGAVPSGKHINLDAEGRLAKKTQGARTRLQAQRVSRSLPELADALRTAGPDTHLTSGWSEIEKSTALCSRLLSEIAPLQRDGFIGLTEEHLAHREGPGLMVIDTDGAYGPNVAEALFKAAPDLASATRVEASSTGSFILDEAGERVDKSEGQHTFFGAVDPSDIPRAIETLHQRLILTGGLVPRLSLTGAFLERSYVDTQLRVSSQPVYLKATTGPGLRQDKQINLFPGAGLVDTKSAIPDLTDDEKRSVRRTIDAARTAMREEIQRTAREYFARRVEEMITDRGVDRETAEKQITAAMLGGELGPDHPLIVEGRRIFVSDVLANPEKYHERNCRDPLEPDYGSDTVAMIYTDHAEGIVIYSFAHGRKLYRLVEETADIGKFEEVLAEGGARVTLSDLEAADLETPEGVKVVRDYHQQVLQDINKVTGLVIIGGKVVVVRRERDTLGKLTTVFNSIEAERTMWKPVKVPFVNQAGRLEWKSAFPVWEGWFGRRAYRGVVFRPRHGVVDQRALPDFRRGEAGPLDLFVGEAYEPKPGKCELIKRHIGEVLCGGEAEAYYYVIGWLARMVQHPEKLAETVLVFQTDEGVGKNTIINIFKRYFGVHATEMTKMEHATGFNYELATCVFLSMNEMTWGGNKAAAGTLKALITDHEIQAEQKYLPRVSVKNHSHIIVSTNEKWAVPVGMSDRRFVILNCSAKYRNDPDYFEPLYREIDAGGGSAFIHWLLSYDIWDFNPRVLPNVGGEAKLAQKFLAVRGSPTEWMYEILLEGRVRCVGIGDGTVGGWLHFRDDWVRVEKQDFYSAYVQHAKSRAAPAENLNQFGSSIKKLLGDALLSIDSKGQGRPSEYRLAALDTLRGTYAVAVGENIAWSSGDEE